MYKTLPPCKERDELPEKAKTSRDTEKTLLTIYVIDNKKIFEKNQDSLEYSGTQSRIQPL